MPKTKSQPQANIAPSEAVTPSDEPKTKLGRLQALLRRDGGATIDELVTATGWLPHSVRGAISGALKKKLGLQVSSEKAERGRVYRIVEPAA